MKKNSTQFKNLLVLFLLITIVSCSKSEDTPQNEQPSKSSVKQILSFVFSNDDNSGISETVTATINEEGKTIAASFPFGTDISSLTPTISVSPLANASPSGANDFSSPVIYEVTAEDGSKVSYTVNITIDNRDAFITTWKTTAANETIAFYIQSSKTNVNYQVDWGDGSIENNINSGASHEYSSPGTYMVIIKGDFPGIYSNPLYGKKMLSVENWGDIKWESMFSAFSHCENLIFNATDEPDISAVMNMGSMFREATNFNEDISNWDVSNVTTIDNMFDGASSFNQGIGDWDVSNVVSMSGLFQGASSFNKDLSSWNVGKVTSMQSMFSGATSFNQDLSNWDVSGVVDMSRMFRVATSFNSNIGGWNVSNVEEMWDMFAFASAFNQDIGSWNVSKVSNMSVMFEGASSFNQDISSWNVNNVEEMYRMFYDATSFSQDISTWATDNVTICAYFSVNSGLITTQLPTAGTCF